jgi:small subunit ribosomal protein S17
MAKPIVGTVASDKTAKTIVVSVKTRKTHPIYKKQYTRTMRIMAHDPKDEAKLGDTVSIIETRPISARKRYTLLKVVERAGVTHEEKEPEA